MSESIAGPLPGGAAIEFRAAQGKPAIPRRLVRARREAEAAAELASGSTAPTWSVASAPAFGSAVPLEDEAL